MATWHVSEGTIAAHYATPRLPSILQSLVHPLATTGDGHWQAEQVQEGEQK